MTIANNVNANSVTLISLTRFLDGNDNFRMTLVAIPPETGLELDSKHLQQPLTGGVAKGKDLACKAVHEGISVFSNIGSPDRHSYTKRSGYELNRQLPILIEVRQDVQQSSIVTGPEATSTDSVIGSVLRAPLSSPFVAARQT